MAETMLPVGCRFRPTDEQLIEHYLLMKIKGQPLSWKGITDCDLYGDKSPWEMFDENKKSYVFTRLKKASKNRVARKAGCGTWHGQDSGVKIYDPSSTPTENSVIGLKKRYTFKKSMKDSTMSAEKNLGHWIMHEYSLSGERCCDHVLCIIEKTVKSGLNDKEPVEQSLLVEEEEKKEESCEVLSDGVLSSTENPINESEAVNESEALIRGAVISDDDVLLANQFGFGLHTTSNDKAVKNSMEVTPTLSSIGFSEYGMGENFEVPSQSFIDYGAEAYGIQNQVPLCDDENAKYWFLLMQESEVSMQELVPTMPRFDSSNEDYSNLMLMNI